MDWVPKASCRISFLHDLLRKVPEKAQSSTMGIWCSFWAKGYKVWILKTSPALGATIFFHQRSRKEFYDPLVKIAQCSNGVSLGQRGLVVTYPEVTQLVSERQRTRIYTSWLHPTPNTHSFTLHPPLFFEININQLVCRPLRRGSLFSSSFTFLKNYFRIYVRRMLHVFNEINIFNGKKRTWTRIYILAAE